MKMDTKVQRVGVVVLAVGAAMFVYGSIAVMDFDPSRIGRSFDRLSQVPELWFDAVSGERLAYRRHWTLAWGSYIAVAGAFLIVAYDSTVGRLLRWITAGR